MSSDGARTSRVTRIIQRGGLERRLLRVWLLEARSPDGQERQVRIERATFRVGAHASNDLVLSDPAVSQAHLELRAEPDGYRIVDLESSNGTWQGPTRLYDATTADALTLTLGDSTLTLRPTNEEQELPASDAVRLGALWGHGPAMRELFWKLEAAAASDIAVLLEGETGVGKERVARTLHERSRRAAHPFVVVDCGALTPGLVEATLFGFVRGAFTGAERDQPGLLEAAHGGTLFLDEIGELPLAAQAKLLGALERKLVQPLGTARARPVDVRVVAATHRDLARAINAGHFRSDLYFRLAALRLLVPPLRERSDDIPALARDLLEELRGQLGEAVPPELSAVALARLQSQPWPGNVRELRAAIERLVLGLLEPAPPRDEPGFVAAREAARARFDLAYFRALLTRAGDNVSEAARLAQLDRRYLIRILERLGLRPPSR
jgi:DNA-binding NtrC family response regulator